jgi:hypothetical protein
LVYEEGGSTTSCLDLVFYIPSRSVSKGRSPTFLSVGITNYDYCSNSYWLIGEVDGVLPVEWVEKYLHEVVMVMKTPKGYHLYLSYSSENPLKVIHAGYRLKILDRGHLSIGKRRERHYLVLRIYGKYPSDPYVTPILINEKAMSVWHYQVLDLVTSFYRYK